MQTFLFHRSFWHTARELDKMRLGKQRVECYQILKALTDSSYGWQSHPAVNMWRGYEPALIEYGLIICDEWTKRGYNDTLRDKILAFGNSLTQPYSMSNPHWLTEEFCSNHRSIMLGKVKEAIEQEKRGALELRDWYAQFGWNEQPAQKVKDKWPYLWPEMENN